MNELTLNIILFRRDSKWHEQLKLYLHIPIIILLCSIFYFIIPIGWFIGFAIWIYLMIDYLKKFLLKPNALITFKENSVIITQKKLKIEIKDIKYLLITEYTRFENTWVVYDLFIYKSNIDDYDYKAILTPYKFLRTKQMMKDCIYPYLKSRSYIKKIRNLED